MHLRDIVKTVVDITGEPMDKLLDLAGKLSILNREVLVIFSLKHLIRFNYNVALSDIKCLVEIVTCLVGRYLQDYDTANLLLHFCVLVANERGQFKG